jgi:hypothetical protein
MFVHQQLFIPKINSWKFEAGWFCSVQAPGANNGQFKWQHITPRELGYSVLQHAAPLDTPDCVYRLIN